MRTAMAQQSVRVLGTRPGRVRITEAGWLAFGMVVLTAAVATAGVVTVTRSGKPAAHVTLRAREPVAATSVLTGTPAIASAGAARALFETAPAIILASTADHADLVAASAVALRAHAPLLLIPPVATAAEVSALRGAIRALTPSAVLAIGVAQRTLAADLPHVRQVTSAGALPVTTPRRIATLFRAKVNAPRAA